MSGGTGTIRRAREPPGRADVGTEVEREIGRARDPGARVCQPAAARHKPGQPRGTRVRILALAQDLPAVWQVPTTTQAACKQLLRFLIKDVTLTRGETRIHIGVRWQTEAVSALDIPRPALSSDIRRTDAAVVARIRDLAPTQTDRRITAILSGEGLHAGLGGVFTASKVQWIRYVYHIPTMDLSS